MSKTARKNLIRLLQSAHSDEMAAAYVYRCQWKSLKDQDEIKRIKQIEADEWEHRKHVLNWLKKLDAKPKKMREILFWTIGWSLGFLCFVTGWFFPMYFAGWRESQNTREYKYAAELAEKLGMEECARDMLFMSQKEHEHEEYFSGAVARHRLLPATKKVFKWS